ncbi:MAG: hypothetical protein Q9176_005897 [Flavoplaca citrina]
MLQGLRPFASHIDQAIKAAAYPFLELYLRHGTDLNAPRCHVRDVALSQTFDNEGNYYMVFGSWADPMQTKNGTTLLSIAVVKAPSTTVQMLFHRGGSESIMKGSLLWTATSRTLPDSIQVLDYILAKGASYDLNKLRHHDRPHLAYYADAIFGHETPLYIAAVNCRLDMVKLLVSKGANPMGMSSDATEAVKKDELAIDMARTQLSRRGKGAGDFEAIIEFLEPLLRRSTTAGLDDHDSNFVGLEKLQNRDDGLHLHMRLSPGSDTIGKNPTGHKILGRRPLTASTSYPNGVSGLTSACKRAPDVANATI